MENVYNKSTIIRPMVRAIALVTLLVGPCAGFAAANANDFGRDTSGAGFVLYAALAR